MAGGIAHLFGEGLLCPKFAYFVVGLYVGYGVGTRGLADRVLVYKLYVAQISQVSADRGKLARSVGAFVQFAFEGAEEDIAHQCAFTGTRYAGDYGHYIERKAYVHAFQIVFAGACDFNILIPRATAFGHGNGFLAQKITHGVAVAVFLQIFHVSLVDNLAAQTSGLGTDVDDIIGGPDDFFVMFHHDHRIAQLLQLAQDVYQLVRVAAVKSDARFVQNVETAHKTASQGSCQIDTLAFTAGQRIAEAVQGEVSQTYIQQEADAVVDFYKDAAGNVGIMLVQLQVVEKHFQFGNGQVYQFGDAASAHPYITGFGLQPRTVAFGTKGFAAITRQHNAVLYLVLVFLQHFKEGIDTLEVAGSVPQHAALFVGQLVVGSENGEAGFLRTAYHHVFPFAHFLAAPAHHGAVVYGKGAVGDDEMFVDAHDTSEAFAFRTCADGGVEREHLVVGLFKRDAVRLELGTETVQAGSAVRLVETQQAGSVTLVHGGFGGVGEAADGIFLAGNRHAVYQ